MPEVLQKKVADNGFIAILSRQLLCCRTHERWFPSRHHSDEVGLLEVEDGCGMADMQVVRTCGACPWAGRRHKITTKYKCDYNHFFTPSGRVTERSA